MRTDMLDLLRQVASDKKKKERYNVLMLSQSESIMQPSIIVAQEFERLPEDVQEKLVSRGCH